MLGVAPATLRRWAEAGEIVTFTTPGGHRRFSRAARSRPACRAPASSGRTSRASRETTDGIAERYRLHAGGTAAAAPWLGSVPESSRERLREHGRAIAVSLIALHRGRPGSANVSPPWAPGSTSPRDYGRIAGTLGATMRQTVATFLLFRRPFVEEMAAVARRRNLDATATASLLGAAAEAIDRLLDATLEGHEQAMTPRADATGAHDARGARPMTTSSAGPVRARPLSGRAGTQPTIVAVILHARSVPSLEREAFAEPLAAVPLDERWMAIHTCHRVEVYVAPGTPGMPVLPPLPAGAEQLVDVDATRHLISVACGLDSAVFGEDQILHQVRTCVAERHADGAARSDPRPALPGRPAGRPPSAHLVRRLAALAGRRGARPDRPDRRPAARGGPSSWPASAGWVAWPRSRRIVAGPRVVVTNRTDERAAALAARGRRIRRPVRRRRRPPARSPARSSPSPGRGTRARRTLPPSRLGRGGGRPLVAAVGAGRPPGRARRAVHLGRRPDRRPRVRAAGPAPPPPREARLGDRPRLLPVAPDARRRAR